MATSADAQQETVPIGERPRDDAGRYNKEYLMKLLQKRHGATGQEIDFIFEYLMTGDQYTSWAQADGQQLEDPALDSEGHAEDQQKALQLALQNERRKDYVLMSARILNFILKYGFINGESEHDGNSLYSQA